MEQGIDISEKPALINLCCEKTNLSPEEIDFYIQTTWSVQRLVEILLTEKKHTSAMGS